MKTPKRSTRSEKSVFLHRLSHSSSLPAAVAVPVPPSFLLESTCACRKNIQPFSSFFTLQMQVTMHTTLYLAFSFCNLSRDCYLAVHFFQFFYMLLNQSLLIFIYIIYNCFFKQCCSELSCTYFFEQTYKYICWIKTSLWNYLIKRSGHFKFQKVLSHRTTKKFEQLTLPGTVQESAGFPNSYQHRIS